MDDPRQAAEPGWKTFLVEHYWPGVTADAFAAAAERVRSGAEELARTGNGIRFLHSTLVPQDELGLCVLAAESQALVEEAYSRSGVRFERIVESVDSTSGRPVADELAVPGGEA